MRQTSRKKWDQKQNQQQTNRNKPNKVNILKFNYNSNYVICERTVQSNSKISDWMKYTVCYLQVKFKYKNTG